MRCEAFYEKWKRCGNFCEKHPDTAEKIDKYLDLVQELADMGVPEERTMGAITERAARPLLSIQDEETKQNALSHIETALNRKTPNGGNYHEKLTSEDVSEIVKKECGPNTPQLFTSESEEWYTPKDIIDAVIEVFGYIDLDPCSPSVDGPVPAQQHYTQKEDGLVQPWTGKVYMNPPYGAQVKYWVEKCLHEYDSKNVQEAIILVAARTDTKWFNLLNEFPWCAVEGRLAFSGSKNKATFPSAIFYLGENIKDFFEVFSQFGPIYHKVSPEEADVV